jgi:hypothetical protein
MIRRAASDKPGLFQQVLAEQLRLHQSSKNLMTLCSKMRLSAPITFVAGKRFEMIDKKTLAGWVFKHTAFDANKIATHCCMTISSPQHVCEHFKLTWIVLTVHVLCMPGKVALHEVLLSRMRLFLATFWMQT